jgi:hypothetical protein
MIKLSVNDNVEYLHPTEEYLEDPRGRENYKYPAFKFIYHPDSDKMYAAPYYLYDRDEEAYWPHHADILDNFGDQIPLNTKEHVLGEYTELPRMGGPYVWVRHSGQWGDKEKVQEDMQKTINRLRQDGFHAPWVK